MISVSDINDNTVLQHLPIKLLKNHQSFLGKCYLTTSTTTMNRDL